MKRIEKTVVAYEFTPAEIVELLVKHGGTIDGRGPVGDPIDVKRMDGFVTLIYEYDEKVDQPA